MDEPTVYRHNLEDPNPEPEADDLDDALDGNDGQVEDKYTFHIPEGIITSSPSISRKKLSVELERKLGIFSTSMIIVNRMIGTGIFSTPSSILQATDSTGAALLFWVLGGVMSMLYVKRTIFHTARLLTMIADFTPISNLGLRSLDLRERKFMFGFIDSRSITC